MTLSEGQMFFIPSYVKHRSLTDGYCEGVVLIIPKKYYEDFEKEMDDKTYSFLPDVKKNKPMRALMEDCHANINHSNELMKKAYANMLLGMICRSYEPEEKQIFHNDISINIIRYVEEHYMENITLENISKYFGYSKYYFSRLFNKLFNCTLNAYINSVRLRAIEEMPGDTNKTKKITDVGFNSLSSYYRAKK